MTHEAGHFFGTWHTNQFNSSPNLMDQGGNPDNLFGVGPDRVFGSSDDLDVDFGKDEYVRNEGFTGTEDTLNAIAFGLSTGRVDQGMVVEDSSPANDQQLSARPTEFRIHFSDPIHTSTSDERVAYLGMWQRRLAEETGWAPCQTVQLAEITDGFSFAYLKELVVSSLLRWMHASGEPFGNTINSQCDELRQQMMTAPPRGRELCADTSDVSSDD